MSRHDLILAHDLGTTGNKSTLFHTDGRVAAATFAGYPTSYPHPNWAEQDPEDWRRALFASTRQLLDEAHVAPGQIAAVSFSGHMNGILLVDDAGEPLRPAIIWADQRAQTQATFIAEALGEEEVYRLTGNRISAAYTAAKWLWLKAHEPDVEHKSRYILQAKDYAAYQFCGEFASDYSDASLTLLFDLEGRRWARPMIKALGLDPGKLPEPVPSATVIGRVSERAARETGLVAGTPVVIGGGDGACATVGAGAVAAGDLYNYIGSSSWIALAAKRPLIDAERRTFNLAHLDPELNIALGTMQAAGGAFDWFERLLRAEDQPTPRYETLNALASAAPPGSQGLLFLPYLLGERSPYWNPLARGAFVGLAMPHGRAELTRAVLEGVAYHLRLILDILRTQGAETEAGVRLIGGGVKSPLWRQILADVYGLPVARLRLPAAATALGAAIAGGVAVGLYPDFSVAQALAPVQEYDYPNSTDVSVYESYLPLFKEAYTTLEPLLERLATLALREH